MSRRGRVVLVGGILVGVWAGAVLVAVAISRATRAEPQPRPPELGGQAVPDRFYTISFDERYDLFCEFHRDAPTVYRGCKILGFTGDGGASDRASVSGGFSGFSSSGSGSGSYAQRHFYQWLVLELEDGRLAYIPPGAVKYIEEARQGGE